MTIQNSMHIAEVSTRYLEGMCISVREGGDEPYFTLTWGGVREPERIHSVILDALSALEPEDVQELVHLVTCLAPCMYTAMGSMVMYLRELPTPDSAWPEAVPSAPVRTAAAEVRERDREAELMATLT